MTTSPTAKAQAVAPTQIGKPKEEASTNGFANLLSDTISKHSKGIKVDAKAIAETDKVPKQVLSELKTSLADFDLDHLGEVDSEEVDPKKGAVKLADILADLSHKSEPPKGSEVINIKTVLGSKNDDPNLINKDLIALVPKKDRAKVMKSLIEGAKQILSEQLENRIPKNRVPKTLKGLLETAICFNMVVSDIKLESLPETKVTTQLLKSLKIKEDLEAKILPKLPDLKTKVLATKAKASGEVVLKEDAKEKLSPLQRALKSHEEKVELTKAEKEKNLNDVKTPAFVSQDSKLSKADASKKSKLSAKDDMKLADKESVAQSMKNISEAPKMESIVKAKEGSLEKLLALQGDERAISKEESSSTPTQQIKTDSSNPLKAENALQVKMAESRQLISQLSADVKEAMENYKPPFTELSMKLNPERLGEIDVVMVQRGNNVHINLTSNTMALGLLQQNAAELKQALNSAGLGDANMNFSSNGENRNPSQQEQQKHTTSEHYAEMAKLMDDLDELEIVVPRYV